MGPVRLACLGQWLLGLTFYYFEFDNGYLNLSSYSTHYNTGEDAMATLWSLRLDAAHGEHSTKLETKHITRCALQQIVPCGQERLLNKALSLVIRDRVG